VLRSGARFEGLVALKGPCRIDGCVSGEVISSDLLWIGRSARVNARIAAPEIVIAGEFDGEAEASGRIELLETARVRAALDTRNLIGPIPNPNSTPGSEADLQGAGAPRRLGLSLLEVPVSYVKLPLLDLRRVAEPCDPPEAF